jgi:hypothetical protein
LKYKNNCEQRLVLDEINSDGRRIGLPRGERKAKAGLYKKL